MNNTTRFLGMVLIVLACCNSLKGQTKNTSYQPLEIGDVLPNVRFNEVGNVPDEMIRLADFKGKLLILDFWTTYCGACIASWPKLLELQERFDDRIQIVLVNASQGKDIIEKTMETQNRVRNVNMTLPYIANDTVLKSLFPYKSVPHVVWISPDGSLLGETAGDVLNERNITTVLNDEPLDVPQKTDEFFAYDLKRPLFIDGNNGGGEQVYWRSVLSKSRIEEKSSRFLSADDKKLGYQITIINRPVKELYQFAYTNLTDFYGNIKLLPKSRTQLQVRDTSKYVVKVNGEINRDNFYSYQTFSEKPVSREQLQAKMQMDLSFQFGLNVEWKPMVKKCLVFTMEDSTLMDPDKTTPYRLSMTDTEVEWNQVYMSYVIDLMEIVSRYYYSEYPILDETNFNGLLRNIHIKGVDVTDYRELDAALRKYGLRLRLEDRMVNVLVIGEANLRTN